MPDPDALTAAVLALVDVAEGKTNMTPDEAQAHRDALTPEPPAPEPPAPEPPAPDPAPTEVPPAAPAPENPAQPAEPAPEAPSA